MSIKIEVDLHTHTVNSGHASGTIEENAKAAFEAGLKGLGVSDHAPNTPGVCGPEYFLNIREIPRKLNGVNIYYGIENNLMDDGSLALSGEYIKDLDYCIVGIHGFCYEDHGIVKNTDNLIKAMSHPLTYFVSHPDDGTWPIDYENVVLAAKELGVALELNNSHVAAPWRKNCLENIDTYLKLCMKHKSPIFLGSDAHESGKVGKFDEAIAVLEALGFDEDLIINTSEEKFRKFIHFKK